MNIHVIRKTVMSLLLLCPMMLFAQVRLSLDECYERARNYYPKMKQTGVYQELSRLNTANLKSAFYPQLELKGQATYQSDVISINLPLPNFEMPSVSKDQYKLYLDVRQTIWDGGITQAQKNLEEAALETNIQKVETEVYQLKSLVNGLYFGILLIDQNISVLNSQREMLFSKQLRLEAALRNGAVKTKDVAMIQAEILRLDQQQIEIESNRNSLAHYFGILLGIEPTDTIELEIPNIDIQANTSQRPELQLFDLQRKQIHTGNQLLDATRYPKIFGFGQAGYGRPAFNMLSNEFDAYYIVGIGASWQITDWNRVKRSKQSNLMQMESVDILQKDFDQKQSARMAEANATIQGLKKLMETDNELLQLRQSISQSSASELENGTITTSDYLTDFTSETVAKLNAGMHKIKYMQAIANYNTILGN